MIYLMSDLLPMHLMWKAHDHKCQPCRVDTLGHSMACIILELVLVSSANLVERESDDSDAQDSVEVVLQRTAKNFCGTAFDEVNEYSQSDLCEVSREYYVPQCLDYIQKVASGSRMITYRVNGVGCFSSAFVFGNVHKKKANNDDWPSCNHGQYVKQWYIEPDRTEE